MPLEVYILCVPRNVHVSQAKYCLPELIWELESKASVGCNLEECLSGFCDQSFSIKTTSVLYFPVYFIKGW